MARKLVEKRRRGIAGWLFLGLFWTWNVLMVVWLVAGLGENASKYEQLTSEAARTGHAAGTGIAFIMILLVWALGAIIFGLLAYFTRGRRELIEMDA